MCWQGQLCAGCKQKQELGNKMTGFIKESINLDVSEWRALHTKDELMPRNHELDSSIGNRVYGKCLCSRGKTCMFCQLAQKRAAKKAAADAEQEAEAAAFADAKAKEDAEESAKVDARQRRMMREAAAKEAEWATAAAAAEAQAKERQQQEKAQERRSQILHRRRIYTDMQLKVIQKQNEQVLLECLAVGKGDAIAPMQKSCRLLPPVGQRLQRPQPNTGSLLLL